jgi:hypothetical protein
MAKAAIAQPSLSPSPTKLLIAQAEQKAKGIKKGPCKSNKGYCKGNQGN